MDPSTSAALVAELLKSGLLGVMVIGLAAGLWYAVRAYMDSQKSRFDDHAKNGENLTNVITKSLASQADTNVILTVIREKLPR